jgi:type I restriction enzyme S subunit
MPSVEDIARCRLTAVPSDWLVVSLGEVCETEYGLSETASETPNAFMLGMRHLADGVVRFTDLVPVQIDADTLQKYRVEDGDLLFNRTNSLELVGKTSVVRGVPRSDIVFASYLVRIHLKRDRATPEFVNYFMNSGAGIDRIKSLATPGVGQYNVNPTSLRDSLLLPLPPISEQKKIATILAEWDQAIGLTEKLIAAKQHRKAALMQQLLTGKVRLSGFRDTHWDTCTLGDVASNSARRIGTTTPPPVYSVTNSVGMVPMDESVVGASIDRYKAVAKHDFAYNPMRINVGSIAMWHGDEEVLVSPDYVVFRCGPDLDPEFLNHYRTSHQWDQFVTKAGGGSVRVRIYFSDLAELPLKLPPVEEQKAIAAVLNTQDCEILLLQRKLDALRRQKKGLMQQLLTGRVRVRVDEPPGA